MSKFDEALERYEGEMRNIGVAVNAGLLKAVAKGLGPSIYNADASKVSCSNAEELNRVKTNFLIKKLGLRDSPTLDAAIQEVCQKFGSSNRNKYRAVFYYMLVKKFGKEGVYK